jgi:hypothetical protein
MHRKAVSSLLMLSSAQWSLSTVAIEAGRSKISSLVEKDPTALTVVSVFFFLSIIPGSTHSAFERICFILLAPSIPSPRA